MTAMMLYFLQISHYGSEEAIIVFLCGILMFQKI